MIKALHAAMMKGKAKKNGKKEASVGSEMGKKMLIDTVRGGVYGRYDL